MRCLACGLFLALAVLGCSEKKDKKPPAPLCEAGETMACYGGPQGTQGVGSCAAGVSTCSANAEWGPCVGEVGPTEEICANTLDEDCSGTPDDGPPDLSAFEFPGNSVDDNCNGATDEETATCGIGLASNSADPLDYMKALDLCASTTSGATVGFGVLAASFSLADGTGTPLSGQRSLRQTFGTNLLPRAGAGLTVFATGAAASTGQLNPSPSAVEPGVDHGSSSAVPPDWFAANGNAVPVVAGCPSISSPGTAHDSMMLTVQLKVPSNARAVAFDAFFLTADYPEYACSPFSDVFVALLDSAFAGTPANPADKNIARAASGAVISASCSYEGACPFTACQNGATGCGLNGVASTTNLCAETTSLAGSGFEVASAGCPTGSTLAGGGTGWITGAGNVVPGETITLRFAIWEVDDGTIDSTVLLDNVRWLPEPVTPGLQ